MGKLTMNDHFTANCKRLPEGILVNDGQLTTSLKPIGTSVEMMMLPLLLVTCTLILFSSFLTIASFCLGYRGSRDWMEQLGA
jgi:hypothetical protein